MGDVLRYSVTHNLQVRNADVEALVHIGVPHDANISDKEGSEVTLRDGNQNHAKKTRCHDHAANDSASLLLEF